MKKWLMIQFYRIQQAQSIVGPILWSLTITGIWWPILGPILIRANIITGKDVIIPLLIVFILTWIGILTLGYLYDKLKFWHQQIQVSTERNPFSYRLLTEKEIALFIHFDIPLFQTLAKNNPDLKIHIKYLMDWLKENGYNE